MAIKAVAVDDAGVQHLIIGLNREDVESILAGNAFTLPQGNISGMSEESDVVLLFGETDAELEKRFPPMMRPS